MQLSLKTLVAAVALTLASTAALAQTPTPVPQNPATLGPHPNTGNGGVFLTAWNPTTSQSLVQYLNLNLNNVLEPALTPDGGLVLDFGVISGITTLAGANAANVRWHVTAFDQSGGQAGVQMVTTASRAAGQTFEIDAPTIEGAANFARDFYNSLTAACGGNATPNPCVTAAPGFYAGSLLWGDRLGNNLPVDAFGLLGSALQFYYAAGTEDFDLFNATIFQNATGFGQWLLGNDGHLTYSIAGVTAPVPLPAAVWLLFSGLAGLGVVGRRRKGSH